jgi:ubiquinone biosynthesis protein UbiJ
MIQVREKVAGAIAGGALLLSIIAVHVNTQTDVARMAERIDSLHSTNVQTLEVLNRLAMSIEKLSNSVARLDERTKVLEREERRN